MDCKPDSTVLLDALVSQIKDILLNKKLPDGSNILDFLDRVDAQEVLKISIDISAPKKIQEFRHNPQDSCMVLDARNGVYVEVCPCPF
jgi:hypothetical protein